MKRKSFLKHFLTRALPKIRRRHAVAMVAFLTVLTAGHSSHAQFNQGRMLVGGVASFSSLTTKDGSYSTKGNVFTLSPQVGYFVINHLAVGLDVSFGSSKQTASSQ